MTWKSQMGSLLAVLAVLGVVSFAHFAWDGQPLAELAQRNLYALLGGRRDAAPVGERVDPVRQALAEENRRLQEALALSSRLSGKVVVAQVVRREPQTWWSQLHVEFLPSEGSLPPTAAVVLTPQGVIGRLEQESISGLQRNGQALFQGTVELLSSPKTQLSVVVGEKETPFLLEGRGGPDLLLRPVTSGAEASIIVGEPVTTSGLGRLYSRGLQVAVVKDPSSASFTSCSSTPAEVLLWWR